MKILFFADRYGYNFYSIKRVIHEELVEWGIDVIYRDKAHIHSITKLVKEYRPDQVWLAHSSLVLPLNKDFIDIPVLGFGFGDPHYFTPKRLQSYDAYVTAHHGTYLKHKGQMPVLYSPDPYGPQYFRGLGIERDIFATCIGLATHPRFPNPAERIEYVNKLRVETNLDIRAYGKGWPSHPKNPGPVNGNLLLNIINRSQIGLDIQGGQYSLSERVFHYGGCGTPIITRDGPEVDMPFKKGEEILTYENYDHLRGILIYYARHPEELRKIGLNAQKRCLAEHTVHHRVGNILNFMGGIKK